MQKTYLTIARKSFFSSGVEREDCGNSGFNYCFEVYINGPIDPTSGLVINLTDIKTVLLEIIQEFDQRHIRNDLKLKSSKLEDIHQNIHHRFLNLFAKQKLTDMRLEKSVLYEGKSRWSEIAEK